METWRGQHCRCQKIQTHTSQKNYYFYLYMLGQDKYVFMWLCASAHKCVHVEVRGSISRISLSVILHLIFERSISLNPKVHHMAQGPAYLCPAPQCWNYRCEPTAPDFYMGAGHLNASQQVCELNPLSAEPSPQLLRPVWRNIKNDKACLLKSK